MEMPTVLAYVWLFGPTKSQRSTEPKRNRFMKTAFKRRRFWLVGEAGYELTTHLDG